MVLYNGLTWEVCSFVGVLHVFFSHYLETINTHDMMSKYEVEE